MVVGNDADEGVAESEAGKQGNLHDLVVDAEGSLEQGSDLFLGSDDLDAEEHHHSKHDLHQHGRKADGIDLPDDSEVRLDVFRMAVDLLVEEIVEEHGN